MKNQDSLVSGPFAHQPSSVSKTMGLVMLALLPATAFGIYEFGWPALYLFSVTVLSCLLAEAIGLRLAGKPVRIFLLDGSAILTGWLLALSLPPWAPWWIGVLGAFLAIIVGKHVFGGLGQNLFNPAMVARVALLISFPLEMTTWVVPQPMFSPHAPDALEALAITFGPFFSSDINIDAVTSASVLGHVKTELGRGVALHAAMPEGYSVWTQAMGTVAGSMGETSTLLVLAGGLFLLFKRIISWHIPFSMMATLALLATLFNLLDPQHYPDAGYHLVNGATLLCAFFIATDLVTSPVTRRGQILFGIGCGALVYVIRTWAGYPEGAGFAIMLMNALTPLIDHYLKPRIYGRDRKGSPIQYDSDREKT
jgi:electron transport complex protein RnfD